MRQLKEIRNDSHRTYHKYRSDSVTYISLFKLIIYLVRLLICVTTNRFEWFLCYEHLFYSSRRRTEDKISKTFIKSFIKTLIKILIKTLIKSLIKTIIKIPIKTGFKTRIKILI